MGTATHSITHQDGPEAGLGRAQTYDANSALGLNPVLDPNIFRKVEYHVYVYSVADREIRIKRPPIFPNLVMPARGKERYVKVTSLPSPLQTVDRDLNGNLIANWTDGRRAAMDLINPNNWGIDQDATLAGKTAMAVGVNNGERGVFWSLNDPPTEEEIRKAEGRKETYYRALLERARVTELSDPAGLQEVINKDYHLAAEYFGVEASWHRKLSTKATCRNCGEEIRSADVAFHKTSDGVICVLDWERTVKAGVKHKSDVPPGMEYWDTTQPEKLPSYIGKNK
jgi:hypothetical protein